MTLVRQSFVSVKRCHLVYPGVVVSVELIFCPWVYIVLKFKYKNTSHEIYLLTQAYDMQC